VTLGILLVGACALPQLAEVPNASAVATTLYVAKGGGDTGNCQSATAPCASISYAMSQAYDAMSRDATIDVGPGTFKANLDNPWGFYLTIQGSGPERAQATTLEPEAPKGSIVDAERGGWTLDQLTLKGLSGDPVVSNYAGSIDLVDSTITNSANAVTTGAPSTAFVTIDNSTISENGVGVFTEPGGSSTVDIADSTIADNGVGIEGGYHSGVDLAGTIVSGNRDGDCAMTFGNVRDAGYNLGDDGSCGFSASNHSQSGVDPDLGLLQNNGGPTKTQSPALGSPVLGQIPPGTTTPTGTALCSGTDQRGVPRPAATNCDIGADEMECDTATVGVPFSFKLTTFGTPVPSITEKGQMPRGLDFVDNGNGTATISGSPTKSGTYHITITFGTRKTKDVVTQPLTLTVNPG
jgi:hypothetical protein